MFQGLKQRLRERNYLDLSSIDLVNADRLARILRGEVKASNERDSTYFIIHQDSLGELITKSQLRVDDLNNAQETFNRSQWFGKFSKTCWNENDLRYQIIVPNKFDVLIEPKETRLLIKETERACYYGSGNLQLDKDLFTRVLKTNVDFEELKDLVNKTCSDYQFGFYQGKWKW